MLLNPLHDGDVIDAFTVGAAAQNVTQYAIEQTHDIPFQPIRPAPHRRIDFTKRAAAATLLSNGCLAFDLPVDKSTTGHRLPPPQSCPVKAVNATHTEEGADIAADHGAHDPSTTVIINPPPSLPGIIHLAGIPAIKPK